MTRDMAGPTLVTGCDVKLPRQAVRRPKFLECEEHKVPAGRRTGIFGSAFRTAKQRVSLPTRLCVSCVIRLVFTSGCLLQDGGHVLRQCWAG